MCLVLLGSPKGRGEIQLPGDNQVVAGTAAEQHCFFPRPQRVVNSNQIAGSFAQISRQSPVSLTGFPPLTIHLLKTGLAGAGRVNLKPESTWSVQ